MTMRNYIYDYYAKLKSGEESVGKWVMLAYSMIIKQLDDRHLLYSAKDANRAIKFVEGFCHHFKGRRDLVRLELWQKAAIASIFGLVDQDGIRQYREIFIVMARKNGKSLLASAIAAYAAYLDGEYGAEIYCLAPKLEQAEIVFDGIWQMIHNEPELDKLCKKTRSGLYIAETNTWIKKIAFNAKKSDGFNPHVVICDEPHAWVGDAGLKQYEVMKSALGARRQPFILAISTAGYINNGIYDELMTRSTAVLNGSSKEQRLLPLLYTIDDPEKWDDINELRKSNPNLGVSVSVDFLLEEMAVAEQSLSKRAEFLTKYCNIKQNSSIAFLEYTDVEAARNEPITLEDFRGCYGLGGIDLSQTTDLTAASVVIERGGKLYVFCQFFMPAIRIRTGQQEDGVPYEIFVQRGFVTPSGTSHVDYRDVYQWFVDLVDVYGIRPLMIGYDRYSAKYLVDDLNAYGFKTDNVHQGENLTPVLMEFEGWMKDRKVIIGDNDLLMAHFLNVALKHNLEQRRFRPVKITERARIDGFVSVIDAMTVRQKYYTQFEWLLKNEVGSDGNL